LIVSLLLAFGTLLPPATARASVLDDLFAAIKNNLTAHADTASLTSTGNLQTMELGRPAMNLNPAPATGGGDITVVDDSALMPEEGPSGTLADISKPKVATISIYIVRDGDTLSSVAKLFGVTSGTILSANDLPAGSTLQVGEKLVILPITGINYTVKKGDTLESIAKHYGGDAQEIASYNEIDNSSLSVGTQIIIPNGEVPATSASDSSSGTRISAPRGSGVTGPSAIFANNPKEPAHNIGEIGTLAQTSYYIAPLSSYTRTQGIHGYNAVDLAAPRGTPIMASAAGDVIVARSGGWNGGYGSYVVIQHDNGSQTLYAHMSKVATYDGAHVQQGEVIGYVGATGEATGPHVHFEIRDGIRNPF
jgi:murein DD-endopeptidase MepM/ murein hydrolase activator NlpD